MRSDIGMAAAWRASAHIVASTVNGSVARSGDVTRRAIAFGRGGAAAPRGGFVA
jgi:hypothetical protein